MLLVAIALGLADVTTVAPSTVLLLANATIIDGTPSALPYVGSLLLASGKIHSIHPASASAALDADIASLMSQAGGGSSTLFSRDLTGQFVLPGFVDLLTHISIASAISSDPTLINDIRPLFNEYILSPNFAPGSRARLERMLSLLRTQLLTGVTTFVDSVSSVADVERVAKVLAMQPSGAYPNFYSLGPIVSPAESHPFPLDNTPYKYMIDATAKPEDLKKQLLHDLASWYAPPVLSETMIGAKVVVDSNCEGLLPDGSDCQEPGPTCHCGPNLSGAQVAALKEAIDTFGAKEKVLFFFSYNEDSFVAAADAGATVHLGGPLVNFPTACPPPPWVGAVRFGMLCNQTIISHLASKGVSWLSLQSNYGGNIKTFLETSYSSSGAPRPDGAFFREQSFVHRLTPAEYNGYETMAKLYAKGDSIATAFKQNRGDELFDMNAKALRLAKAANMSILAAEDAGSIWAVQGNMPLEAAYLSPSVLTPMETIVAMTSAPAKAAKLDHLVGTLAAGKRADLVILAADPLIDASNVGRIVDVVRGGAFVGGAISVPIVESPSTPSAPRSEDDAAVTNEQYVVTTFWMVLSLVLLEFVSKPLACLWHRKFVRPTQKLALQDGIGGNELTVQREGQGQTALAGSL